MITSTSTGDVRLMPADEYHARTDAVSNSMLSVYRQSRRTYHARFVTKTEPPKKPTPQMLLGSIVHALLLEPEEAENRYVAAPKCDRRTKAGKEAWLEFCAASGDKTVVDADVLSTAQTMTEAVHGHAEAFELLDMLGQNEVSAFWTDADTGLLCKLRLDAARPGLILDIKTARDPSPQGFAREVASLGYHRQNDWYVRGWESATGERCRFAFIVVGNQPPHEVAVYELDAKALELGQNQNHSALRQLAASYRNDDWKCPWEKGVKLLSLPTWAVYSEEWEIIS